jgi:hypothetical protein
MLLTTNRPVLTNSDDSLVAAERGVPLARSGVGLNLESEVVVQLEEVGEGLGSVRVACGALGGLSVIDSLQGPEVRSDRVGREGGCYRSKQYVPKTGVMRDTSISGWEVSGV